MKYKYYFFDFDGMLVNSYDHIVASVIEAFKESRNIKLNKKEVYEACKISMGTAFNRFGFTQKEIDRAFEIERNPNFKPLVKPFKESLRILKRIKKLGGYNYIYTNREKTLEVYFERFGFDKYLDGLYRNACKPDPAMLENAISDLKLEKEKCIMIGDRKLDIDTGIASNIDTLLFDFDNLASDATPTYKIDRLKDIYKILDIKD